MKILCVGIFTDPSSTNIQMARAIKKKNHNVFCFDYLFKTKKDFNQYYRSFLNIIEKVKLAFFKKFIELNRYYFLGNWKVNRQLLTEVMNKNYDVVFFSKTPTINYRIIPKLNRYTKTWYFFMDPLYQAIRISAHKYACRTTWSNATFSSVNSFFKMYGANSFFITEGFNASIFKPDEKNPEKVIDVIFVGEKTNEREKFINFLEKNKINILCFGKGWNNDPIYLEELVDKFKRSKIVLNFTRDKIGFSDRVFLTLGIRLFLISEYCRDLERFFKKKVHLEWFRTPEELLYLIQYYLKNDFERNKIAEQGFKKVIENFTWDKIIEKIFQKIDQDLKKE